MLFALTALAAPPTIDKPLPKNEISLAAGISTWDRPMLRVGYSRYIGKSSWAVTGEISTFPITNDLFSEGDDLGVAPILRFGVTYAPRRAGLSPRVSVTTLPLTPLLVMVGAGFADDNAIIKGLGAYGLLVAPRVDAGAQYVLPGERFVVTAGVGMEALSLLSVGEGKPEDLLTPSVGITGRF